jgi:hypothetical protein
VRRLALTLEQELYERLLDQAKRNERDPVQEARYVLKRELAAANKESKDTDGE